MFCYKIGLVWDFQPQTNERQKQRRMKKGAK
jgi:hypothetical protein